MTRWQVFSAVALRRLPELMPKKDPIVTKVQQIFDTLEASKSRYSQHEIQHIEDIKAKENEETDIIIRETAQDREDRWLKEKSDFKFGEYNDRLSKMQYLFVHTKFGTDIKDQWLLPQAEFDRKLGDSNLLDTARRALKDSLSIVNGYRIVSKVPSSVCSFKYPLKVREMIGYDGAKVFYLKAHLDQPDSSVLEATDDANNKSLKWMTREEALSNVSKTYIRGLSLGLLDECRVDVDEVFRKASKYVTTTRKLCANVN
uniref:39S ribosomal protein L46, mitochondrial n=1 Tax=Aceria tosichella TaxID=561515 RepID=A0A6G1S3E5_9ACAR